MPFCATSAVDVHQRFSLNYMPHWALSDLNFFHFSVVLSY